MTTFFRIEHEPGWQFHDIELGAARAIDRQESLFRELKRIGEDDSMFARIVEQRARKSFRSIHAGLQDLDDSDESWNIRDRAKEVISRIQSKAGDTWKEWFNELFRSIMLFSNGQHFVLVWGVWFKPSQRFNPHELRPVVVPKPSASVPDAPAPSAYSAFAKAPVQDEVDARLDKWNGKRGNLRITLIWYSTDDLDLYATPPRGEEISYGADRDSVSGGHLDLDMNVNEGTAKEDPIENIYWERPPEGNYKCKVHLFAYRTSPAPVAFKVVCAVKDEVFLIHESRLTRESECFKFDFDYPLNQ